MKPILFLSTILLSCSLIPLLAQTPNSAVALSTEPPTVESLMAKEEAFQVNNTLRLQNIGIRSLLRRLAGRNQKYLDVRPDMQEERVTAFIRSRSTALATKDIANLLGGMWRAIPSTEHTEGYTILHNARAISREEELWAKVKTAAIEPYHKLVRYLKISPEEYRKLEAELRQEKKEADDPLFHNGNLFSLRYTPARTAIALLGTLSDEQIFEGIKSQRYFLSARSMTDTQKRLALELAKYAGTASEQEGGESNRGVRLSERAQFAREFGIFFYFSLDPLKACLPRFEVGFGGAILAGASMGKETDFSQDLLPVRGSPYAHPITKRLPKYPELESQTFPEAIDTAQWKNATWDEVLTTLSANLNLPLYSDSYSYLPTPQERGDLPIPDLVKKSMPEALDALCNRYHYLWWYQDGAILFRSRTWFIEKLYEVPFPTITLLEKQLKAKQGLDADAITALADLTPRQMEGLGVMAVSAQGGLQLASANREAYRSVRGTGNAYRSYNYLRVFKLLSADQKREAMGAAGIPFEHLSKEQQRTLSFVLIQELGSEVGYQPKDIFFKVKQSPLAESSDNTAESNGSEATQQSMAGVQLTITALERPTATLHAQLTIAIKRGTISQTPTRRQRQEP